MTLALALMLPLTLVSAIDVRQTVVALPLGIEEENRLACWLIPLVGLLPACLIVAGGWLVLLGGLALLFPDQWTAQAFVLVIFTIGIVENHLVLKSLKEGQS